jgi:uncharacterized surface protein with fasciclin (FAS1) repeats
MKKLIALAAMVAIATGLMAAAASARPEGGQPNLIELARNSPDHKTFAKLVIAADLVDVLSDRDANLTVFAPNDAAFEHLEADAPGLVALLVLPENKETLREILLYHVLGKEAKSRALRAAAKAGSRLSTLLGKEPAARIELSLRGGKIRIDTSADLYQATVTAVNRDASNGVLHVINRVLIPQSAVKARVQAALSRVR